MTIPGRSFCGQQHLSGLEAALGVFAVATIATALYGFSVAATAPAGAMCVSIVDHPSPTAQQLVVALTSADRSAGTVFLGVR